MAAAAVQIPIGVEDNFKGLVDLVHWKAIYNQGVKGYVVLCSGYIFDITRSQNRCRRFR